MPILTKAEAQFTEYLQNKGLKLTSQRRTILATALASEGHYSAESLLKSSQKKDPTISKATVYRTLEHLKQSGILEEQDFGEGRKVYEKALGVNHHDHFVCVRCNRILEFENRAIEDLQDRQARKLNFKIVYHSLKLFGFCSRCHK